MTAAKKAAKKPQDRKPKAAKRVRDEAAQQPMETLLGRTITIDGRLGSVDVTILDDPLEWDADVTEILAGWAKIGNIVVAEVIPLIRRIISLEDGAAMDRIRPTQRSAHDLIEMLMGLDSEDEDGDEAPVEELGESQAS